MTARYQHCGVILVRSTTDPGDLDLPPDVDFAHPDAAESEGRAWLAKMWARGDVREALTVASPDLGARITRLLDPGAAPPGTRDLRRAILAAASYLLRWQRRVTPFGLFAGIIPATVGPATTRIGTAHCAVARADADWVTALAQALEQDPAVRQRLTVIADNTAMVRDGRLILGRRVGPGSRTPGQACETSIRWTRPVQAALEMAACPVGFTALADGLASRFPAVTVDRVRTLLDGLVEAGFLITSLRPPMTADDPLAHLAGALRTSGAGQMPGAAVLLDEIERIHALIRAHDMSADAAKAAVLRAEVTARMTALGPADRHPLTVDVRLDGHVSIPRPVLDEAAAAADVLLRLTTRPFGSMAWLEYHARFRERYGPGALVPVRDLVADSGLGYPDGYPGAVPARPVWRALTERDAALLALIQQAALDGSAEICLAEADIQALTIGEHAGLVPPPRVEIGVALYARSAGAIRDGDFELRVVAAPRTPTSMAGRFARLLAHGERELLAATYASREPRQDAVAVQLSFPPRLPHNENVVRVAPLVADVLPLGEHPPGGVGVITVDDLAVTADAAQMYLVHRPTGQRVIPRIPHALDMTVQTPPLARFLAEVADARSAGFGPFDLGAARTLPYVPRIRYRRTVLAPARWLLASDDLAASRDSIRWEDRLTAWRRRWRVPSRVVACHGELRLPLDLEHALDRSLLRARLERAGRIELREDGPPDGGGWLGRPAELLIPLTLASPSPRPLPVTAAPGTLHRPGGSAVVCAQLAGNPARFDDIIGGCLPVLASRLAGLAERWWVRRHRDMIRPGTPQHLAVYLRLASPGDFAEAAAELAAFAEDLHAHGLPGQLTLTSCPGQPARYGHGDALSAAENVFAADTAAAIAQLAMAAAEDFPGQALAAASMTQLAASFAPDPASGYRALTRCLEKGDGPLDRALCDQTRRLADPAGDFRALRSLPGGDAVAAGWAVRDTALTAYYRVLAGQRDPHTVLRTLLHEHHMRALGLDPQAEKQTGRMARAAAQRQLALAGRM